MLVKRHPIYGECEGNKTPQVFLSETLIIYNYMTTFHTITIKNKEIKQPTLQKRDAAHIAQDLVKIFIKRVSWQERKPERYTHFYREISA